MRLSDYNIEKGNAALNLEVKKKLEKAKKKMSLPTIPKVRAVTPKPLVRSTAVILTGCPLSLHLSYTWPHTKVGRDANVLGRDIALLHADRTCHVDSYQRVCTVYCVRLLGNSSFFGLSSSTNSFPFFVVCVPSSSSSSSSSLVSLFLW